MSSFDLFGREDLVAEVVREIKKGKHLVLTGAVGSGKSALLIEALKRIEPRQSEWYQFDPVATEAGEIPVAPAALPADPTRQDRLLVYVSEHQAKGQLVEITRRLLQTGIMKPSAIGLPDKFDTVDPGDLSWKFLRKPVTRTSIRDLSQAIIPAIHAWPGKVLIAADDLTSLTPTQQDFWLAVADHAQIATCASERKAGLRKLWWRMTPIEVPPLEPEAAAALVRHYISTHGMLIESPELFIGHVVKQAGGNPQALMDMLGASSKERRVDKRKIREMKHAAGVSYVDFTPVMLIMGAAIVGTRYLAMGIGDRALYILAGMAAAVFVAARFFLFKGAGKATG